MAFTWQKKEKELKREKAQGTRKSIEQKRRELKRALKRWKESGR